MSPTYPALILRDGADRYIVNTAGADMLATEIEWKVVAVASIDRPTVSVQVVGKDDQGEWTADTFYGEATRDLGAWTIQWPQGFVPPASFRDHAEQHLNDHLPERRVA